jgi:hypothetical protein
VEHTVAASITALEFARKFWAAFQGLALNRTGASYGMIRQWYTENVSRRA